MSKKYLIKEGKAVTTKRGCLGPGVIVTEKDFTGGKETIENLLKSEKCPIEEMGKSTDSKKPDDSKSLAEKAEKAKIEKAEKSEAIEKAVEKVRKFAAALKNAKKPEEKEFAKVNLEKAKDELKELEEKSSDSKYPDETKDDLQFLIEKAVTNIKKCGKALKKAKSDEEKEFAKTNLEKAKAELKEIKEK